MTFFIKTDTIQPNSGSFADLRLSQRARASMDALGAIQVVSSSRIRERAQKRFESDPRIKAFEAQPFPLSRADQEERLDSMADIAKEDSFYRLERFLQRVVAEENFVRGIPAVEEQREKFDSFYALPESGPTSTLDLGQDDLEVPEYWSTTDWHLEPGGWDGYDLYGPMMAYAVGPSVFRHGGYAYLQVGADIRHQRVDFAKKLPKESYGRIAELGCGGGTTLFAIHRIHPEAELVGFDLSKNLLRGGYAASAKLGISVDFKRRDAANTGEPAESYDAVVTYAIHHEMPVEESIKVFKEAYRMLKPGGDFLISDVPPFHAVSPFNALLLDWETKNRGEPYFRAHCSSNWAEELKAIGFEVREEGGIGPNEYPYVISARKPA